LFLSLFSCSSSSLDDYREEGEGVTRAIIAELRQIRSRDDLLSHSAKLQTHFNALADIMIRAHEFRKQHPDAELSVQTDADHTAADQLRLELNRVINIEGGADVIEKAQEEALHLLNESSISTLTPGPGQTGLRTIRTP
jgi:hypothetical protein